MSLLLGWTLASFFVGFLGRKRRFGFWGYSVFAFFATPLVAALALLFAAPRRPKTVKQPPLAQTAGAVLAAARTPIRGSSVAYFPILIRLVVAWLLVIVAATGVLILFGKLNSAEAAQYAVESATFARTNELRLQENPVLEMAVVNLERVFVLLIFAWAISRFLERLAEHRINRATGEAAGLASERLGELERRLTDQQQEIERLRASALPTVETAVSAASSTASSTAVN